MGVETDNGLAAFQTWINKHPFLPQNIEPLLLRRYLQSVRNDLEKAKKLIEYSFTMRNNNPEIFLNRDPLDKGIQKVLDMADLIPLPYPTKDNYKVLLYRMSDYNPDKFLFTDSVRTFFMVADVRLATQDLTGITDGEIPIFDMTGFSLKHLTKVVISSMRVYLKYSQEAHPVRLRHVHVINCSSFLDRVLTLVKPFIKSEVFKLIHFHLPGSNTLEEFVPKELLPTEYGGKAGDLKDLRNDIVQQIMRHREYLMDESRWKIRPQNNSYKSFSDLNGNFKTLSID